MSQYDDVMNKKAVALRYDENKDVAPVIVASGLGYMAERIVEMANENAGDGADTVGSGNCDPGGVISGDRGYLCIFSEI